MKERNLEFIKIPHAVIVRAPRLLPMLYKVRELAEETGIKERTLRDWLVAGAPHQRDSRGHIWISGEVFAQWIVAQTKKSLSRKLNEMEAYCMHCNSVCPVTNPVVCHTIGKLFILQGTCPSCEHTVYRGISHDKSKKLLMGQRPPEVS